MLRFFTKVASLMLGALEVITALKFPYQALDFIVNLHG